MAKKAVLIGINRYRIPGADLRGCVPDVKNMSNVLQRQYGFESDDISLITDFEAMKEAMETAISELVRGGKRGDVLLVHYSGHGSSVPDENGDEEDDNRDEILCPTNLDWYDPMRDDWLRTVFDGLRDGVSLTVITDSCHSGRQSRGPSNLRTRPSSRDIPSAWDIAAAESGRDLAATTRRARCTWRRRPNARRATSCPSTTCRKS